MEQITAEKHGLRSVLIYVAVVILVIGLLFVIFPETSAHIICYIVGAVLCVWGVVRVVGYFRLEQELAFSSFGLVRGAAAFVIGLLILIRPDRLAAFLTVIFALVMIVDGILKLQYAIDILRMRSGGWSAVLIYSALMVVLGVIALCNPFDTAAALMVYLGICLIVDALLDIFTVFYFSRLMKKAKQIVGEVVRPSAPSAPSAAADGSASAEPQEGEFRPLE